MANRSAPFTDFKPVTQKQTVGRPKVSSIEHLEKIAVELFAKNGYQKTTIEDVAAAAGVSRSTVFRYINVKNQLLWLFAGDHLAELERALAEESAIKTLTGHIQDALIASITLQRSEVDILRKKLLIIAEDAEQMSSEMAYRARGAGMITAAIHRVIPETKNTLSINAIGHSYFAATFEAMFHWATTEGNSDELAQVLAEIYVPLNLAYEPYLQSFAA